MANQSRYLRLILLLLGFLYACDNFWNLPHVLPETDLKINFSIDSISCSCYAPAATVRVSNHSENAEKFLWEWGDGSISEEVNPSPHIFTQPGIYTITLKGTDRNGESNSAHVSIKIKEPHTFSLPLVHSGNVSPDANVSLLFSPEDRYVLASSLNEGGVDNGWLYFVDTLGIQVNSAPLSDIDNVNDLLITHDNKLAILGLSSGQPKINLFDQNGGLLDEIILEMETNIGINSFIQAEDLGFAIVGEGGDGKAQFTKLKPDFSFDFSKPYGSNDGVFNSIIQDPRNGNYFLLGKDFGDVGLEDEDFLFRHINPNGGVITDNSIIRPNWQEGNDLTIDQNGDIVLFGSSQTASHGIDFFMLKLNRDARTIGTPFFSALPEEQLGQSIISTTDRGLALFGDGLVNGSSNRDFYLIKLDEFQEVQWDEAIEGKTGSDEFGFEIIQTPDCGFAMVGKTSTDIESNLFLVKVDAAGNQN